MTKDMTSGSPMKLILGFSVPLLFGFLFQQFYNLVDTLIVGRFLGVDALAAVGSTGSLNFLIIGFCMGVCNGFAIPLAHRFGAGDYKAMRAFMMNAVYLAVIFSAVMTVFTVAFCRPILQLMQTPENIIDDAYTYIVIIFAGIPATHAAEGFHVALIHFPLFLIGVQNLKLSLAVDDARDTGKCLRDHGCKRRSGNSHRKYND